MMKRLFVAAALAVLVVPAHAGDQDDARWFGTRENWFEHPCGLQAFSKYGQIDTPEVRRAYELTKAHPELCSKLFP
jgi:hypothetical protein